MIERANQVFKRLYAAPKRKILIHGDLHYWNVHVHQGELYVLDFGDMMLGYPVQDIAIALSYGRDREGYHEWREAFREGYTGLRRWPAENEQEIETLMAARSVMFINYVAHTDPAPQEYIADVREKLKQFLALYG